MRAGVVAAGPRVVTGLVWLAACALALAGGWLRQQIVALEREAVVTGLRPPLSTRLAARPAADILDDALPVARLIDLAASTAARLGLHMDGAAVSSGRIGAGPRPAPESGVEVSFEVHGRYSEIKLWMIELLDRFEALTVQQVDLHADGPGSTTPASAGTVQGRVTMHWHARSGGPVPPRDPEARR